MELCTRLCHLLSCMNSSCISTSPFCVTLETKKWKGIQTAQLQRQLLDPLQLAWMWSNTGLPLDQCRQERCYRNSYCIVCVCVMCVCGYTYCVVCIVLCVCVMCVCAYVLCCVCVCIVLCVCVYVLCCVCVGNFGWAKFDLKLGGLSCMNMHTNGMHVKVYKMLQLTTPSSTHTTAVYAALL